MDDSSDRKFQYEHNLHDLGSKNNANTAYQPINPLQPSVTLETPHDALQQAVRRHFRINGLLQILNPWKPLRESPKIALHKGRRFAVIYFLSVLIPLLGAIALIIINTRTTPLGFVSSSTVSALQFVAKFLDILMQVTLTTLALDLVRKRLLGPDPLPFGALLAPFRVADASYLWSLDLWGSITSSALHGPYRIFFCILVPLIILLAAVTGPSSAILVIPRRIQYLNDERLLLFNESTTMYPTIMRLDAEGKLPAESELYVLAQGVLAYAASGGYGDTSTSTPIQDASGTRLLSFLQGRNGMQAFIPTRLTGSFLTSTTFQRSTDFVDTIAIQPYVASDCHYYTLGNQSDIDDGFADFGPGKEFFNQLIPWSSINPNNTLSNNATTAMSTWPIEITCPDDGKDYTIDFRSVVVKNPDSNLNYSALYAGLFADARCASFTNDTLARGSAYACTLNATWSEFQVNSTANAQVADSYPLKNENQQNITVELEPDFVMRLISLYMSQVNDTNVDVYLEPLLAVTMANSLPYLGTLLRQDVLFFNSSKDPSPADYFTQQQIDAARSWINTNKLLTRYSSIWIFGLNNWTDPSTLVQLDLKTFRAEYGYSSESIPVRLALGVFAVYVLITATHIIYTLITGETGTSWDSVADLVMLALNSRRPPGEIGATSIGVDSIITFREPVNVRVNENNTAELVFDKDNSIDGQNLTRVRRNLAY